MGSFPILSETFVLNQITGLIDRSVEIDVFPRWGGTSQVTHAAVEEYDLLSRTWNPEPEPERTAVRRAAVGKILFRALLSEAPTPVRLRRLIRYGRVDANSALGFDYVRGSIPRRYDAIHCHFGTHAYLGLSLRSMGILDGPLLTTFHGYDMSRVIQKEGEAYYDRLFAEGDLFLPISEFWHRRLVELGCPPERIRVHRMGVDCDSFVFRPRFLPQDESLRLVSVARLTEKKGIEYAIRAVARLASEGPAVDYTIVGDGPLRGELESLVDELGVSQCVRLLGRQPHAVVREKLNEAHVVLAPSVTAADGNMEGIPVALMEAMATGLPVISTLHSGIPELVRDGETGLLVEERDAEGLAQRIRNLMDAPELYRRLAMTGRALVEQEYNIRTLNDELYSLLGTLPRRRQSQ